MNLHFLERELREGKLETPQILSAYLLSIRENYPGIWAVFKQYIENIDNY